MAENPVRTRQLAFQGIAIRTVTTLAGSEYRMDQTTFQVDLADDVILRIRYIKVALRGVHNTLGAVERCISCGAAIAAVAGFTISSHSLEPAGFRINTQDTVAFAQHQVDCSVRRHVN